MAYQDAFAQVLGGQGVAVDPSAVPDQASVDADVQGLNDWLGSLEEDTRGAIDELAAGNAIQAGLADAGIVSSIGGVLAAFDATPSSFGISTTAQMIADASSQAAATAEDEPPPPEPEEEPAVAMTEADTGEVSGEATDTSEPADSGEVVDSGETADSGEATDSGDAGTSDETETV